MAALTPTDLHHALASYLQTCHNLGQRQIELSGETTRLLRAYRHSAQPPPAVPTTSPAPEPSLQLPAGDKPTRMTALADAIRASSTCRELFRRSKNMVLGTGDLNARLMFIGEAPGLEEDLQGEPFVGPAGQLLNKMISAMGLERSAVYIANICKFRPDMPPGASGNRKPTPHEMEACLPFLRAQIDIIQPAVIVALGATAVEGLFSLPRAPIMKLRGQWMQWQGHPVMPTYHPAYLLRNPAITEKRRVWEDLMQVMQRLNLPISAKQRAYFTSSTSL